jgi:hypothetical protein
MRSIRRDLFFTWCKRSTEVLTHKCTLCSTPEEIAEREAAKAKGPEASRNLLEGKRLTRSQLGAILAPLMEAVRSTVACECVYTRCAAIKVGALQLCRVSQDVILVDATWR